MDVVSRDVECNLQFYNNSVYYEQTNDWYRPDYGDREHCCI